MATYTQTERPLQIQTALGPDALLLARFEGEEAISRLFRFELELASPQLDIDGAQLLRTPAAVSFPLHDGSPRTLHGLFSRFAQTGKHEDLATYRADLVAWPWFLTLRRNRRIFQQKSILDIAEELFRFWGFNDFDFRCEARSPREYVVQYDESDWDFLSRWFETEGIFYFFEHSPNGHTLVLADSNSAVQPCPDIAEAWMRGQTLIEMDVITSLAREHAVQIGRVTLRDYDYLKPSFSLESSLEGDGPGEIFDYPGSFTTPDDGERYARYQLEAQEARKEEVRGEGTCRWMTSGHSFDIQGHFNPQTNGQYILTSVRHVCSTGGFRSSDPDDLDYRNTFRCIPASVPYRPLRLTPRPVVKGSQTAVVVGPAGEEVWTDQYGRVKVQFHWDREGANDASSSCWVRVATPWGGKGYGSISVPRIENEVLVAFLEANPDQPVVVGSVYNAEQVPPFAPGIQMGMNSRSSPGGGGRNEISLTDTQGSEMITIHGQHDMETTILNDRSESIGNDETVDIGANRTEAVGADESIAIGNDQSVSVGSNQSISVGSDQSIEVGGSRSESVGGSETVKIGRARTHVVALNDSTNVGAAQELTVGGLQAIVVGLQQTVAVGRNQSTTVGSDRSATVGKNDSVKVGKNLTIDAGDQITLKTGKAIILMKKDGTIQISGKDITIKGTGKINVKASKDVVVKGKKILQN